MQNALIEKRTLITQAADFKGPALCEVFAEQGASVVADTRAFAALANAEEAVNAAGAIDVLVVNLSVPAPSTPAPEVDDAEWRRMFAALSGPLPWLVKAAAPGMAPLKLLPASQGSPMPKLCIEGFTISLDAFGVGHHPDIQRNLRRQRLIDELHIAISPVLPASGERLFEGVNLPALGCACTQHQNTPRATPVVFTRQ